MEELLGKTLIDIRDSKEEVRFFTDDGLEFLMSHYQDCCEYVRVEEVIGDYSDLIGSPILRAEEVSETATESSESGTWTFYKLATIKGEVVIRWLGESNGYYSERVDFCKVN